MIFRSSYNWYESAASLPHLPEYCVTIPVSNIVPSSNDVITNQIFIAFRRERRDVQVIREMDMQGKNKAAWNRDSDHPVRSLYKAALIWFCQNYRPSNSVDKLIWLQYSAKEAINVEIYLLCMTYTSLTNNVFIFSRPCSKSASLEFQLVSWLFGWLVS
jgi:hypothetical protein